MQRHPVSAHARWPARGHAFVRTFLAEVLGDRLLGLAGETAFFAVLSIFPGLLIAASLLGLLDVFVGADLAAQAQSRLVWGIDLVLTDEASGAVGSIQALFEQTRGELLTAAAVGALVTLSGAFAVVIEALNIAYDTDERRSWLRRRLLGLLMGVVTMMVVALTLAVLVIGPLFGLGEALADLVVLGAVFTSAWTCSAVAASCRRRGRVDHDAVPLRAEQAYPVARRCAVVTTVLWLAASAGFHVYLRIVANGNPLLGAFGGGIIVMTWVYLLSLALLLGGELNATLQDRRYLRDE